MKNFFLLFILIHLSSSSLLNIPLSEIDLEGEYLRYLDNEEQESYAVFEDYLIKQYKQYHLYCLKWLEKHQYGNGANYTIFWMSLKLTRQVFNPKFDLLKILKVVVKEIRYIIQFTEYSDELIFKKKFEVASLMIETVKEIYPKLKSHGFSVLVNNIEDRIATWKFLIGNISIDFNNCTVDYDSLFRTFDEIRYIIIKNLSSARASHLSKLCSLLCYYLKNIYRSDCLIIFNSYHPYKPLIISLVQEVRYWLHNESLGEFNSNRLSSYLIKLYKDKHDLMHLNLIKETMQLCCTPNNDKKWVTKVPRKIFTSFIELIKFLDDNSVKSLSDLSQKEWNCKAYAEFESYLKRNGMKVRYRDDDDHLDYIDDHQTPNFIDLL